MIAIFTMHRSWFFALALSALAVGCSGNLELDGGGSGGGIGGSGIIAGSDIAIGTIDGFGSIYLNGRRYDVNGASVVINGQDASAATLAIGMQVRADVDFDTLEASAISYFTAVSAPVDAIDTVGETLTILGRRVLLRPSTLYEGVDPGVIGIGQVLEVSGPLDTNGNIVATLVRTPTDPTVVMLSGAVDSIDTAGQNVTLGALRVDFSNADLSAFENGFPREGDAIFVIGARTGYDPASGVLQASSILPADQTDALAGTSVELSGVVTRYMSSSSFDVSGDAVSLQAGTRVEFATGSPADRSRIALNSLVEVEGRVDDTGVIQAERVIITPTENSEFVGFVDAVDTASGSVVIFGITVQTSPTTRFKAFDEGTFSLASLRAGDYVEIKGAFDGGELLASLVEREEPDTEAELQGPVTSVDAATGALSVLGVAVTFGERTDFEIADDIEVSQRAFLEGLSPGMVVKIGWDEFVDTGAPADKVELESDSD